MMASGIGAVDFLPICFTCDGRSIVTSYDKYYCGECARDQISPKKLNDVQGLRRTHVTESRLPLSDPADILTLSDSQEREFAELIPKCTNPSKIYLPMDLIDTQESRVLSSEGSLSRSSNTTYPTTYDNSSILINICGLDYISINSLSDGFFEGNSERDFVDFSSNETSINMTQYSSSPTFSTNMSIPEGTIDDIQINSFMNDSSELNSNSKTRHNTPKRIFNDDSSKLPYILDSHGEGNDFTKAKDITASEKIRHTNSIKDVSINGVKQAHADLQKYASLITSEVSENMSREDFLDVSECGSPNIPKSTINVTSPIYNYNTVATTISKISCSNSINTSEINIEIPSINTVIQSLIPIIKPNEEELSKTPSFIFPKAPGKMSSEDSSCVSSNVSPNIASVSTSVTGTFSNYYTTSATNSENIGPVNITSQIPSNLNNIIYTPKTCITDGPSNKVIKDTTFNKNPIASTTRTVSTLYSPTINNVPGLLKISNIRSPLGEVVAIQSKSTEIKPVRNYMKKIASLMNANEKTEKMSQEVFINIKENSSPNISTGSTGVPNTLYISYSLAPTNAKNTMAINNLASGSSKIGIVSTSVTRPQSSYTSAAAATKPKIYNTNTSVRLPRNREKYKYIPRKVYFRDGSNKVMYFVEPPHGTRSANCLNNIPNTSITGATPVTTNMSGYHKTKYMHNNVQTINTIPQIPSKLEVSSNSDGISDTSPINLVISKATSFINAPLSTSRVSNNSSINTIYSSNNDHTNILTNACSMNVSSVVFQPQVNPKIYAEDSRKTFTSNSFNRTNNIKSETGTPIDLSKTMVISRSPNNISNVVLTDSFSKRGHQSVSSKIIHNTDSFKRVRMINPLSQEPNRIASKIYIGTNSKNKSTEDIYANLSKPNDQRLPENLSESNNSARNLDSPIVPLDLSYSKTPHSFTKRLEELDRNSSTVFREFPEVQFSKVSSKCKLNFPKFHYKKQHKTESKPIPELIKINSDPEDTIDSGSENKIFAANKGIDVSKIKSETTHELVDFKIKKSTAENRILKHVPETQSKENVDPATTTNKPENNNGEESSISRSLMDVSLTEKNDNCTLN